MRKLAVLRLIFRTKSNRNIIPSAPGPTRKEIGFSEKIFSGVRSHHLDNNSTNAFKPASRSYLKTLTLIQANFEGTHFEISSSKTFRRGAV